MGSVRESLFINNSIDGTTLPIKTYIRYNKNERL